MKNPIVVFDFDKTLTNKDTIFGYFKYLNKGSYSFFFKRIISLFFAFLYKSKILNNRDLKNLNIKLFLKGISRLTVEKKSTEYADKINLNDIYKDHFLATPKKNRLIISASFEEYLEKLFPGEHIIGSQLRYGDDRVIGLNRNTFGIEKLNCLTGKGITEIDTLYTDSFDDLPLMRISNTIILVENGKISKTITNT